jgi:spermidine synthase
LVSRDSGQSGSPEGRELEYVEVARASSARGEVVLRRRTDPDAPSGAPAVLELRVNGIFVMDSLETTSETALARAALAQVESPRTVLVGGLGLGFTAHEVLSDKRVEHVVVAEIEDALVRWFRDGTIPHGRPFLADERVSISVADVQQLVEESPPDAFDLILLDVDNGPDFLVFEANAGIYESSFLERVRLALRPGGALAIWSSTESLRLAETMELVFGNCAAEDHPVVLQGREDVFWLHVARMPQGRTPQDKEEM